jgi:hypothetical protein
MITKLREYHANRKAKKAKRAARRVPQRYEVFDYTRDDGQVMYSVVALPSHDTVSKHPFRFLADLDAAVRNMSENR